MKSNKTTNTKSGKKILKKLYKLLDKLVITPISTVVFKIQKRFGKENNLEKLLNRPYALLFISFAVPKSPNLTLPSKSIKIFDGLTSK